MTKRRSARRTRRNDGESATVMRQQRAAIRRDIEREHKAKARAVIASKRAAVKAARAHRKDAAAAARAECKADRAAVSARVQAERVRELAALKVRGVDARAAARAACVARRAAVGGTLAEARAALAAEKREQAELRRIEAGNRAARPKRASRKERASESDDAVRAELEPEELALWDRVGRSIKASPGMSRAEAFRRYVEQHPEEVAGAYSSEVDDQAMREAFEARSAPRLPSLPPPASSYPAAWDDDAERGPDIRPMPPPNARTKAGRVLRKEAADADAVEAERLEVYRAQYPAILVEFVAPDVHVGAHGWRVRDAREPVGVVANFSTREAAVRAANRSNRAAKVAAFRGAGAILRAAKAAALRGAGEAERLAYEAWNEQASRDAGAHWRQRPDKWSDESLQAFREAQESARRVADDVEAEARARVAADRNVMRAPQEGDKTVNPSLSGVVRYVTRGVLGGAYKARGTHRTMQTHAVGVGLDDQAETVLCRGVDPDNIADPMANPEGDSAFPTCPRCLERLPRAVAALGASARERNPRKPSAASKTRWPDEMILESVAEGGWLSPEARERAFELADAGLIDMSGLWKLTDAGLRAKRGNPRKPSAAKRTVDMFTPTQASGTGQASLFVELSPSEQAKEKKKAIDDYRAKHWGDEGNAAISSMRVPDPTVGVLVQMGELVSVTYRTTKKGDPKRTYYEHDFEGPLPILAYSDEGLIICAGGYTIENGGITG
jgi:hypothetical protein